ncbi:MAG TPA: hypothetical protein VGJ86_18890 [Acidimicrobiales bacterium]|jgi:hypothetical protein
MAAAPNRVSPFGEIVAIDQRGLFMGNRGSIHRGGDREIARLWQVRRWITCVLEYKGWAAPKWVPGRWTPLFFWDEAVALAAGHRPCALCRRADYNRWLDGWEQAFGERLKADPMDLVMHADRLDGRTQRRHALPWSDVPVGAFVVVDDEVPALVLDDRLVPWSAAGYGSPVDRPSRGTAFVATPASTVQVLRHGYEPVIHSGVPRT